ncbi:MAG: HAD family phosphatase [Roseburia sp.]|nr:HAD family phosphatase [Roseburia sp.]
MKAVVFDMDGVLFDTERLCMDSWCRVAESQGLPDMEEVFPRCIGSNSTDTREIIRDYYGEEFDYDGFRKLAGEEFWRCIEERGLPEKPGVRELLTYLQDRGVRIALASSTRRQSVEDHLERAGIREYFSVLVTGDMIVHSKPEPEIYLMACEELGVQPKEAYAIEDSYNGIRSAYRAGMMPLMVPDIIPPDEEMKRLSLGIFKDLAEVKDYLEREEKGDNCFGGEGKWHI